MLLSLRVCSGSSSRGFPERKNPILPPAWIVHGTARFCSWKVAKLVLLPCNQSVPCFFWETTEMLIGGWDGQCSCSAGCCMAAGRPEPSLRISVLKPVGFRWSWCDCCALCIGMRKNAQGNMVFLPRGLKGKHWNSVIALKIGQVEVLCYVLQTVETACEFSGLVAVIWCCDGTEFPLLILVTASTVLRSVCLIFNKCFSEALYWSCMLNAASKIILEGMYLPNPVTFSRLLQKRNLKVI